MSGAVAWAVVAVLVVGLIVFGERRRVVASLGAVVASLRRTRPGRAALVLGWMWLGWHLFAR